MNSVIHINDKLTVSGGVEVYLSQLQPLLRSNNWNSDWVSATRLQKQIQFDSSNPDLRWKGTVSEITKSPIASQAAETGTVFHIHSLSDPTLLDSLLNIAPCIRTAHEPRMTCPGQGRFWHRSERVCELQAGAHCLLHAYRERCCNRHPRRLIEAIANTRFERLHASKRYSRIIANSNYTSRILAEAGFPPDKISTIHYFTAQPDQDQTEPAPGNRILFVGRLSFTKGVHHLLDAMKKVAEEIPDAHLTLVGDGINRADFEKKTNELNLANSVTFEGWADSSAISQRLDECSVFAFPSIYPEAFGISGIEAMAHGRPTVGYDVGGVSDWLKDNETGLLVSPGDKTGLAEGIISLLKNPQLAKDFGARGREIVESRFNSQDHLHKLIGIYNGALNKQVQAPA